MIVPQNRAKPMSSRAHMKNQNLKRALSLMRKYPHRRSPIHYLAEILVEALKEAEESKADPSR
jgi:hypothetical protein